MLDLLGVPVMLRGLFVPRIQKSLNLQVSFGNCVSFSATIRFLCPTVYNTDAEIRNKNSREQINPQSHPWAPPLPASNHSGLSKPCLVTGVAPTFSSLCSSCKNLLWSTLHLPSFQFNTGLAPSDDIMPLESLLPPSIWRESSSPPSCQLASPRPFLLRSSGVSTEPFPPFYVA